MNKLEIEYNNIINQHQKDKEHFESLEIEDQNKLPYPYLNFKNSKILNENLYIFGNTGVGKTYFVTKLISGRGHYFKWYDIINDSIAGDEKLRKYIKQDIIVIDDFLSKKPTEFNINLFYEIIDKRLEDKKQTIITTNYSPNEFRQLLDRLETLDKHLKARIISRMNLFKFHEFKGEDKRKNRNEGN